MKATVNHPVVKKDPGRARQNSLSTANILLQNILHQTWSTGGFTVGKIRDDFLKRI